MYLQFSLYQPLLPQKKTTLGHFKDLKRRTPNTIQLNMLNTKQGHCSCYPFQNLMKSFNFLPEIQSAGHTSSDPTENVVDVV